jgi:hypothetical protein
MSKLSKEFKEAMTIIGDYFNNEENDFDDQRQKYQDAVKSVQSYVSSLEKKKKREKKKEEGDTTTEKPKKKPTSYFLFMKEMRPTILKDYPDLKVTEQSKKLGELWKALSDAEKEEWKVKAKNL